MFSVFARPRLSRWAIVPVLVGFLALSGCSLHSLLHPATTPTVTPQEATVTAVVRHTPDQSQCQPTLIATPAQSIVFTRTLVSFLGTCWPVGATVELGALDHTNIGPVIVDLVQSTTVKPDGTFLLSMKLDDSLTTYVWDAHLPIAAFTVGYAQLAAVSLAVSS